MDRNKVDLEKLAAKSQPYSPYIYEATLSNIITGLNANADVNVQDLFTVDWATVEQVEGKESFSIYTGEIAK